MRLFYSNEAMKKPKNKPASTLGSFPIVNVIFSTMMALLVTGAFTLLLIHANKLRQKVQENVSIQVFLHKKITENDIIKLDQLLRKEAFVLRKDEVPQVIFVSKQEAAETLIQETGENFIEILQENPLRDSFILYINPLYQSNEKLQAIKQQISQMAGVFEIHYVENLVAIINKNVNHVSIVLIFFALLLLVAVVTLINNTIKLALYSQRFLIRSMNLVGATASFIRQPFLVRAMLIGLLAGILADITLLLSLHYANLKIELLASLQQPTKVFLLMAALPLGGMAITTLGTYWSINKYIHLSLDKLY